MEVQTLNNDKRGKLSFYSACSTAHLIGVHTVQTAISLVNNQRESNTVNTQTSREVFKSKTDNAKSHIFHKAALKSTKESANALWISLDTREQAIAQY